MPGRVAIVGAGYSDFRSTTPGVSYKEMMFDAASRAYADAGVSPRRDVQSFVTATEDYWEGTSIVDEYVPDQLGAVLKPTHTIGGEGIQAMLAAAMQIEAGLFDLTVVEAHSKASNVRHPERIVSFGFDPIWNRPLGIHPDFVAGLEMRRFLDESGNTAEHCAGVVVKNRRNALKNPLASYPAALSAEDVLAAPRHAEPLGRLDRAQYADGCVVLVLASADRAAALRKPPIWIRGGAWLTETAALESRDWARATYARLCADRLYRDARISQPDRQIDLAEVDDTYSYKELQHLEALRLCRPGEAGHLLAAGAFDLGGDLPVNASGGSLGQGNMLEATGLRRVLEVVWQLRGEAGPRQIPKARVGLAMGWRGIPTTTCAAVILEGGD
ncbi:MAG: thiolase C-terminal domain-containing protein [Chloroflexota bacterium]